MGQSAAVLTGITAARANAALKRADELGAADRDCVVLAHLYFVTLAVQPLYLPLREAALDEEDLLPVSVARMVHGLLGGHAVVYEVREHLHVALGLHRTAHVPEDGPEDPGI